MTSRLVGLALPSGFDRRRRANARRRAPSSPSASTTRSRSRIRRRCASSPANASSRRRATPRGVDWNGKQVAQGPNPQTGPFFVEGAEPGDMLVVTIEKIEINRATGVFEQPARAVRRRSGRAHRARRSRAAARELDPRQGQGHGSPRRQRHRRPRAARCGRCSAASASRRRARKRSRRARPARSAATWTTPA